MSDYTNFKTPSGMKLFFHFCTSLTVVKVCADVQGDGLFLVHYCQGEWQSRQMYCIFLYYSKGSSPALWGAAVLICLSTWPLAPLKNRLNNSFCFYCMSWIIGVCHVQTREHWQMKEAWIFICCCGETSVQCHERLLNSLCTNTAAAEMGAVGFLLHHLASDQDK